MDTIHIAYCADENYLEYLSVSLMSVLLNNKKNKIHFHLFLYNVSNDGCEKLKSIDADISIYSIDNSLMNKYDQKFTIKHLNMSTYMRLIVPRMLFGKVDKFIYLDIDTLCFSDLSDINNIDISKVVCAASSDSNNNEKNSNIIRLKLKNNFYFNAGFLYININNWMKYNIEDKVNEIVLNKKFDLVYYDQDALNLALEDYVISIDKSWNYLYTWMRLDEKENYFFDDNKLPKIIHFTGGRKPWYKEHSGLSQNLFIFYKHFTPWKNTKLRSYKSKMKNSDNRVYAREAFQKKNIMLSIKYYFIYLYNKVIK